MVAVNAHINGGVPLPDDLARWFTESFDLFLSDKTSELSLDTVFGFKNPTGQNKSVTAYRAENQQLLHTVHVMVSMIGIPKVIAAIAAKQSLHILSSNAWIVDKYSEALKAGILEQHPTGKFFAYLRTRRWIKNADLTVRQRDKATKLLDIFRNEFLGGLTEDELDIAAQRVGFRN